MKTKKLATKKTTKTKTSKSVKKTPTKKVVPYSKKKVIENETAPSAPTTPKKVTYREMVEEKFFEVVLRVPREPITETMILTDFVPAKDKMWAGEFVNMYCDRVEMELNEVLNIKTRIAHIKNKPLKEIIDYITKQKDGKVLHGWK